MPDKINLFISEVRKAVPVLRPYRQHIAIQVTDSCPVGCSHCILACNMNNPVRISTVSLEKALSEWRNCKDACGVGFSGGEPFLYQDILKQGIALATELGLTTRVTTSAYWAKSLDAAYTCIEALSGLAEIALSIDRYHQKKVPAENILNAIRACTHLGIKVHLQLVQTGEDITEDILPFSDYLDSLICAEMVTLSSIVPIGRASSIASGQVHYDLGCNGLDVPVVMSNGDIWLCCVPCAAKRKDSLFYRGNLDKVSLAAALDESEADYWLLQCLRAGGPAFIRNLLPKKLKTKYVNKSPCETCMSILSDPEMIARARSATEDEDTRLQISLRLVEWRTEMQALLRFTNS